MTTSPPLSDLAIHPGEYIEDELKGRGMTQRELARRMGRPYQAINELVRGRKAVTAETAIELEEALGLSAQTWLNLQMAHDLTLAHQRRAARSAQPVPSPR